MCIIVNAQVQWYVTSKEYNHDDKYYGLLNKTLVDIHSKPLDSVRPSTMPQLRKINRCYQIFYKHQNNCFPFRNLDSIFYRNLVINFCFDFLFWCFSFQRNPQHGLLLLLFLKNQQYCHILIIKKHLPDSLIFNDIKFC